MFLFRHPKSKVKSILPPIPKTLFISRMPASDPSGKVRGILELSKKHDQTSVEIAPTKKVRSYDLI